MVSVVAIGVQRDNYMYLFYMDDVAFCMDAYEPDIILKALGMEFEKEMYTRDEIEAMEECRLRRRLVCAFTTHSHPDHAGGNERLRMLSPDTEQVSGFAGTVCRCGDRFLVGDVEVECISTFCHTMDSFCYYVDSQFLVTGDTVFFLGCGRFFEGSAGDMVAAVGKIRSRVGPQTTMLYGHDYNAQDTRFAEQFLDIPADIRTKRFLSLEDECRFNPFFNLDRVGIEGTAEEVMGVLRELKNEFK